MFSRSPRQSGPADRSPVGGSCSVEPQTGYAVDAVDNPVKTLFAVTCLNFTDPDEPLNYSLTVDYTGMYAKRS